MPLPILYRCGNIARSRALFNSLPLLRPFSTTQQQQQRAQTNNAKYISKVKNGASFLVSTSLIIGGIGLSSIVVYLIGSELFSSNGDTTLFNRAVSICQDDPTVHEWLQSNKTENLKAYGEMITNDKWTRNRPIVSQRIVDSNGDLHCKLRFHLQSKQNKIALIHAEAIQYKISNNDHWYSSLKYNKPIFTMIYIDVKGKGRHFIIKPKLPAQSTTPTTSNKLAFLSWLGLSK
ncbi:mitochondrial import inner membrane translocase subunit Tim21p [Monosporozyma servazzii]